MAQAPVECFREKYGETHYPITSGRIDDPGRKRLAHLINKEMGMQHEEDMLAAKRHPDDGDYIEDDGEHAQHERERHAASPLSSQRLGVHPSGSIGAIDLQLGSPVRAP